MFEVLITDLAESEIFEAYRWWSENRSEEEAERWYESIYPAIHSLQNMPRRCALAADSLTLPGEVRQLLFGIGRRPTHRILFEIEGDQVTILRVRHVAQDALGP